MSLISLGKINELSAFLKSFENMFGSLKLRKTRGDKCFKDVFENCRTDLGLLKLRRHMAVTEEIESDFDHDLRQYDSDLSTSIDCLNNLINLPSNSLDVCSNTDISHIKAIIRKHNRFLSEHGHYPCPDIHLVLD